METCLSIPLRHLSELRVIWASWTGTTGYLRFYLAVWRAGGGAARFSARRTSHSPARLVAPSGLRLAERRHAVVLSCWGVFCCLSGTSTYALTCCSSPARPPCHIFLLLLLLLLAITTTAPPRCIDCCYTALPLAALSSISFALPRDSPLHAHPSKA
jgi:hypothetical protein